MQLARAALSSHDPLYLDRLPRDLADATRTALERTALFLRNRIEARTIAFVRGARWGRLAACLVLVLYVGYRVVGAFTIPANVAKNKPVSATSRHINTPDGHGLVDGSFPVSYGIHTDSEDSPRIVIDLQSTYRIATVKVYNRGDGWQDEGLPIVVELSVDGNEYLPIGRRETHFDRTPPWAIDALKIPARYVRLRAEPPGRYLALSQVEVFGKK